ncbi:unnamed protein product [Dicrocoelium dendriticum]|nr:unnamed protein product [Dicrocoelium dendriticum]
MPVSSFDRIVNLLNEASLADDVGIKVTKLLQVKELIIHHESSLLDNFFEEVAAFQHDNNFEVKKVVLGFIQDACHVDPSLVKKAIGYMFYLFSSAIQQEPPSFNLLRCLTIALISIYRISLARAVKVGLVESGVTIVSSSGIPADSAADVAFETFRSVAKLKDEIIRLMLPLAVPGQSAFGFVRPVALNEGARTGVISLIEAVIILHSRRLPNSDIPLANEGDISLDQIPDMTNAQLQAVLEASTAASSATLLPGICLVRPRRLSEEAERLLTALLEWPVKGKSSASASFMSCPLLEAVMDSLVTIARQRPQFMDKVVQAFETVHVTLPPYFSDIQVSTVRKKLKTGLLQLLRHPAAVADYQGRITILLTDLGATQSEVMEALHHHSEFHRPQPFVPPPIDVSDTMDHGDVDMRQFIPQPEPPHPGPLIHSTTADLSRPTFTSLPVSDAPVPPPSSTVGRSSTAIVSANAPLQTQGLTSISTSLSDPRVSVSGKFSLAEAEAALRFDDDDDDDDDDMQILTSRRSRAPRVKRQTSGTGSSAASAKPPVSSSTQDSTPTASTALGVSKTKLELPQVDFVTMRLVPRLTTANVADLVLLSMVTLPDQMPAAFQSTYTPIAAAGTSAQIRHLARMLAVQLVVWADESNQSETADNLTQLENLLRLSQEELEQLGGPGIKRTSKADSAEAGSLKDSGRVKKRRIGSVGEKPDSGKDAEDEDALIRANAARRLYGAQPMNISTLVTYNQPSQATPVSDNTTLNQNVTAMAIAASSVLPGLPPIFSNLPPPALGTGSGAPTNIMLPNFNPSQPPPLMHMGPPPAQIPPTAVNVSFAPIVPVATSVSASTAVSMLEVSAPHGHTRPFSLDAVTMPLGKTVQRQLARDAFLRILDGLEDSSTRRTPAAKPENQLLPSTASDQQSSSGEQLSRMKLLTRLTTRRFGGNEFYNLLIDYAIKNLRQGFELLSKLLMQEYCRFRGFQVVGFDEFIEYRRHQLEQSQNLKRKHSASDAASPPRLDERTGKQLRSPTKLDSEHQTDISECDSQSDVLDDVGVSGEVTVVPHDDEDNASSVDSVSDRSPSMHLSSLDATSAVRTLKSESKSGHSRSTSSVFQAKPSKIKTVSSPDDLGCLPFYDCLFVDILQRLAHPDVRQTYFGRFLIEAPLLTSGALSALKRYCWNPRQTRYGFQVLRTLIELRPVGQRSDLLNMLLNFCAVEDTEVRQAALTATCELSALNSDWQHYIESFATRALKKLLQPRPTSDIFPFNTHPVVPSSWNDETCHACAYLFLGLMPQSPSLMHELAKVYVNASPDVKRCILRMVDTPIRQIGLYSAALHDLVDHCPVGAETLITRMIHLLTDAPSATAAATSSTLAAKLGPSATVTIIGGPPVIIPPSSLVERVYKLYRERVHDIRCLIPVLVGLPKQDVIQALPRLVQLTEKVVKEVLTRLLHASVSTQYAPRVDKVKAVNAPLPSLEDEAPLGPLAPEELLVAIHLLEFAKDPSAPPNESKPTKPFVSLQAILHACRVCFAERRLFTQERLSVAIGQLLEQPVLPTLFMRTVMQALALHPRLAGYVINVLVRLIRKQVWKSEKLWDGFIRCCIKTRPQSYQVLLQLPPDRLESVFQREPTMRAQVRRYVENFSSAQRTHISKSIIDVLERIPTPPPTPKRASPVIATSKEQGAGGQASQPPSPSSSGPGTPTRDELPQHDVSVSLVAATAMLAGGPALIAPEVTVPIPVAEPSPVQRGHSLGVVVGGRVVNPPRSPRPFLADRAKSLLGTTQSPISRGRERARSPFSDELESSPALRRDHGASTGRSAADESRASHGDFTSLLDSHNSAQSAMNDDDMEPPILPPTKITPVTSTVLRVSERPRVELDDTAQMLASVDQSPLDWSIEDSELTSSHDTCSIRSEESARPKRVVDMQKLEADRKRLEEEALKFKKLRSERKQRSSVSQSDTFCEPTSASEHTSDG